MTNRRNFLSGAGLITGAVAAASVSKVAMAALPEPVERLYPSQDQRLPVDADNS